jgi:hypothetical protein
MGGDRQEERAHTLCAVDENAFDVHGGGRAGRRNVDRDRYAKVISLKMIDGNAAKSRASLTLMQTGTAMSGGVPQHCCQVSLTPTLPALSR